MNDADHGTHLHREIAEQPEVVGAVVDRLAGRLDELADAIGDVTHVVLVARGSSDNAARYAQYLLGLEHGLPVALATPSLHTLYDAELRFDGALVIGVSQSGRSPDVVGVLDAARRQGRPAIAVTNDPASPLADAASLVLDLRVGPERSVAATKTYTASLAMLAAISVAMLPRDRRDARLAELASLPVCLQQVLDAADDSVPAALAAVEHLLVTGRGLNYATAFEAALKVRELTGIVAEAFSPPDLLHGPIAAVDHGAAALLVAPAEPSLTSQRELVPDLQRRGATIAAITDDEQLLRTVDVGIRLGAQPAAWLTPIVAIVPAQLLAARLAAARGRNLDAPVGLQKVTETR